MKQLRNVSRLLVALVLLISVSSFVIACSKEDDKVPKSSTINISESIDDQDTENSIEEKETSSKKEVKESNSAEWDELLDKYEAIMGDYAKIIKKVKGGDQMAALEMIELVEKLEKFSSQFDNAKDEMSLEQVKRFTELQLKFAELAASAL